MLYVMIGGTGLRFGEGVGIEIDKHISATSHLAHPTFL